MRDHAVAGGSETAPRASPLRAEDRGFTRRVILTLVLAALFLAVAWILAALPHVPLLIFGSLLGAVGLSSLADRVAPRLHVPRGVAVWAIAILFLWVLAVGLWVAGPRLTQQVLDLLDRLPAALDRLRSIVAESEWATALLGKLTATDLDLESVSSLLGGVFRPLASALGVTFSALSAALACAVMATFIAIDPEAYVGPLLYLVRRERRSRLREIMRAICRALRAWLVGRLASMASVAALTFVGLSVLGISEALLLALLAGVLSFVPYVGPVLSVVPAVVASLGDGTTSTLWVLGLYAGIQLIEGNLLTPTIERRAVSMPPGAVIAAQLLLGVPFGFIGLVLATPIAVTLVVAIQGLYLEDVLGERVRFLGDTAPHESPLDGAR